MHKGRTEIKFIALDRKHGRCQGGPHTLGPRSSLSGLDGSNCLRHEARVTVPRGWLTRVLDEATSVSLVGLRVASPSVSRHRLVASVTAAHGLHIGAPRLPVGRSLARQIEEVAPIARLLATITDVVTQIHAVAGASAQRSARSALASALTAVYDDTTSTSAEARLIHVERTLATRRGLFGNPIVGLSLHHALVAVDARAIVDTAAEAMHGVPLTTSLFAERRAALAEDRAAVVAAIAAMSTIRDPIDLDAFNDATWWQLKQLGLSRKETAHLIELVKHPRTVDELVATTPDRSRGLVFRHLVLAALVDGRLTPDERRFLNAAGAALGFTDAQRRRVTQRLHAVVRRDRDAFNAVTLAANFAAADPPVEVRLARTVADNADALWREIRETGDLGVLLARRARGQHLTDDEQRRMWEQLKDVVRAVPSLAVVALPGGFVLLPLLLKVLPFDLRPSSFRDDDFHTFAKDDADQPSAIEQARREARALAPPSFWRRR